MSDWTGPDGWQQDLQARRGDDYAMALVRERFSRTTLSYLATEVPLEMALEVAAEAVREALAEKDKAR